MKRILVIKGGDEFGNHKGGCREVNSIKEAVTLCTNEFDTIEIVGEMKSGLEQTVASFDCFGKIIED